MLTLLVFSPNAVLLRDQETLPSLRGLALASRDAMSVDDWLLDITFFSFGVEASLTGFQAGDVLAYSGKNGNKTLFILSIKYLKQLLQQLEKISSAFVKHILGFEYFKAKALF